MEKVIVCVDGTPTPTMVVPSPTTKMLLLLSTPTAPPLLLVSVYTAFWPFAMRYQFATPSGLLTSIHGNEAAVLIQMVGTGNWLLAGRGLKVRLIEGTATWPS